MGKVRTTSPPLPEVLVLPLMRPGLFITSQVVPDVSLTFVEGLLINSRVVCQRCQSYLRWGFAHYITRLHQRCHRVLPLMRFCSLHHEVCARGVISLTFEEGEEALSLYHEVCARDVSLTFSEELLFTSQGARQRCLSYRLWWWFTHYPESCVPGHGVRQLPTFDCSLLLEQPASALDLRVISTWFVRYSMKSVSKVSVSS